MDLNGKVAVVTGSSSGVGRATAEQLARLGASVIVNYAHSEDAARATVEAITATGGAAQAVRANVGSDAECRALVRAAIDAYGRLDVLVNNAGTTHFIAHADLDAVTDEVFDDIMAVNVKGTFFCTRAAAPHLRASGAGAVVNVASVAGIAGGGSSIPYGASKAAIINMTKVLARVLGPEVRVNCVAPGFIDGSWLASGLGERYEAARAAAAAAAPLAAVCTPETVADSIVALVKDHTFVSGQTIVVNGGAGVG